jgi:hypothetical protein
MKYLLALLFSISMLFSACEKDCEAYPQAAYACPRYYAPVCGCNDVTYSNDCVAESFGITEYTSGRCAE